jgi:hypothetical protein
MELEVQRGEDMVLDGGGAATEDENKGEADAFERVREWISVNGFVALWMALGIMCNFRYAAYKENQEMMMKHPVFFVLLTACHLGFGLTVGFPSFILDRTLKLSRVQGMVIWFLGYFVCLAVDVDIRAFMRQHCADLPLSCLPIYFPTSLVFTFVATHGPWSIVLFPFRLVYNFLAFREDDEETYRTNLCLLFTIQSLFCVFCQYYDQRFNDGTKSISKNEVGAQLAKYTITLMHDVVIPVSTAFLALALLCVLFIFASAILLATAIVALPFVRRHPDWFRGRLD